MKTRYRHRTRQPSAATRLKRAEAEVQRITQQADALLRSQEARHQMQLSAHRRLVQACKADDPMSRHTERLHISYTVDKQALYSARDVAVIWEEVLHQLALGFGRKFHEKNMALLHQAVAGQHSSKTQYWRNEWISQAMRDSRHPITPEALGAAWDSCLEFLTAQVEESRTAR